MATPILDIEEIAENQDDKEITANDAFNALEAASNDWESVDLSSGNVSMTAGANLLAFRRNVLLKSSGNAVPRDLTLPANKRLFVVWNGGSAVLSVKVGSTTITIDGGDKALLFADGTANGLESIVGGGGGGVSADQVTVDPSDFELLTETDAQAVFEEIDAILLDLPIPIWTSAGLPPEPGDGGINKVVAATNFQLPTNLAGSQGHSGTNATGTVSFTLKKNGSSIGTVQFSSGGSTPTLTCTQTDFAPGDRLTIEAPASQDATLSDVGITLLARRT